MAERGHAESTTAVVAAFLGNFAIAVTKLFAALTTGSGSLLAETAHSFADALDQIVLWVGIRRSARGPSERHPLGHGKERYFWALVVALFLFFGGGVFSLIEAWQRFTDPHEIVSPQTGLIVLGLSLVFETISLTVAVRQAVKRSREERMPLLRYLGELRDPALRTVLFEDSAAIVGLLIALTGLGLTTITGERMWDTLGSAAIGVVLIAVALELARDARGLIVGEAPPRRVRDAMRRLLASEDGVEAVTELLAVRIGVDELLVMARLSVDDDLRGGEIERLLQRLRARLREAHPDVREAFLELEPLPERKASRA